jgi:hypothetical protein
MTTEEKANPVYKVVRIVDGRYLPVWVGSDLEKQEREFPQDWEELEYRLGQVTRAPRDSCGIFVFYTLKEAEKACLAADKYTWYRYDNLAILECYIADRTFSNLGHPMAILPVKVEWKKTVRRWVDITKECSVKWEIGSTGGALPLVHHGARPIFHITTFGPLWVAGRGPNCDYPNKYDTSPSMVSTSGLHVYQYR